MSCTLNEEKTSCSFAKIAGISATDTSTYSARARNEMISLSRTTQSRKTAEKPWLGVVRVSHIYDVYDAESPTAGYGVVPTPFEFSRSVVVTVSGN